MALPDENEGVRALRNRVDVLSKHGYRINLTRGWLSLPQKADERLVNVK